MDKWKIVRLGDVCEVVSGSTPKTNCPEYWDGDIKWITPAEIDSNIMFIYDTERHITAKAGLKPMPTGTVLLSSRAPIGKVAIAGDKMCCNQGFKNLICSDRIYNRFLYRYLKNKTEYLNSLGRGATFKEISKSIVEEIEIPLPPLDVQKKIADVLDKASELIDLRRAQLDKLDLLIQSQFIEMFGDPMINPMGWPEYIFSDITLSRLGKMLDGKRQTGKYRYPYLANYNVQWFHFDLSKINEMDFDEADRLEFKLKGGDLLVCEGGEVGRCAIWRNEINNCYFQKAVHRVRCDLNFVLPEYLAWWFKFRSDYNGFEDIVGSKSTIAHLPGVKLKKLQVVVPPVDLQKRFALTLQQVDKSKFALQQSLFKLELNYKSLMQKCFRGELF